MTVKINYPNPFGPLTKDQLHIFELNTHIRLPTEYRDFLLTYNGGKPEPSFFWITFGEDGSSVQQFYGLHDGPHNLSIDTYTGEEGYRLPKSVLPIADDGVGNFICLGISLSTFGKVFFMDHDSHPVNDPDSMRGITKIANSFSEFLFSLTNDPDP